MKFVTLALLGFATKSQAMTIWSTHGQMMYTDDENSQELIQLQAGGDLTDHPTEYFLAGEHGQLGAREYERVVPARFSADSDDIFMRSMIQNYAMEEKTEDGVPSGRFWMNESITRAAAREVLETHKGLSGNKLNEYLDTYFQKAWGHFDVNRTGLVEVIKMPQFMRFLASDQYMSLQ
jgi:hypothetical protein